MQNIFGETEWQIKLGHDGMNFRLVLSRFPKYFNDFSLWIFVALRPACHLKQNFVIRTCAKNIFGVDKKISVDFFEVRNDECKTFRQFYSSYKAVAAPRYNFCYSTFGVFASFFTQ